MASEKEAVANYNGLIAAEKKKVEALTDRIVAKTKGDTMTANLANATAVEKEAVANYNGLIAAEKKEYCDEQIAKTEQKKSELDEDIAKITSRIDQAATEVAQLKAQVKGLGVGIGSSGQGQDPTGECRDQDTQGPGYQAQDS